MKIIELLNMISKGEEVPKKIKYRKCIFEYEEKYKDYFTKDGIIPTTFDTNGIFRNIFLDYNNFLNDEVEIIEEYKPFEDKIEKIDFRTLNTQKEKNRVMKDTINKIIDKLDL